MRKRWGGREKIGGEGGGEESIQLTVSRLGNISHSVVGSPCIPHTLAGSLLCVPPCPEFQSLKFCYKYKPVSAV